MGEMDEPAWDRLIHLLRNGDCTPFIGAGACGATLPTGRELSREMAGLWGYPYADPENLTRVTQFGAMRFGDPIYVKKLIRDRLVGADPPDFAHPLEPHGLLAGFPIPVYLTTNYDDFIYQSLVAVGKRPSRTACPWNPDIRYARELFGSKAGWNPQPDFPLIYHLHGTLEDPHSVVLTEDDYLDFMVNLAHDRISTSKRMLPPVIQAALTRRSLLFIGYSLQDWTFRFMFTRLAQTVPAMNSRRHISVQLAPEFPDGRADPDEIKNQLETYYEKWKISIFWGSAEQFCHQLRERMGATS
ncbi:SIR2 family NAD-dependent protein deacylase [Acrocarpospora catenulata]|uniref:SIR2 family NAD-dependent protein deacylase n=1 Tax=Acrocarpospora catenulata TaxID=2836182 RepID=UPI001BD98459|nr:SIR2 family protein [Acrocarpospora catenulata]